MSDNSFKLKLQATLDKAKSILNIKTDIKSIELKLPKMKLQGTLDKTATKKDLNAKLKSVTTKVKVDADTTLIEKKVKKIGQQKANPTITPAVDNSQVEFGLKQAQKETKTLWDRFMNGQIKANLIRMSVQQVTQAIQEAISAIKELDTIKTNIQMVSGSSDPEMNVMMSSFNAMAKELSSTTGKVAEAANAFLQMGESVENTNKLIESSQILSKVGMVDSLDAANYLISSMKGYRIAAEDSMDIVNKLTSVDLEAAASAGGLAEALSKCANTANDSGVSMDRLIGYTAAVGEITQKSMSEVGNSFQSLLSRMNNIKIGKLIDDETGESLSDTEVTLNKLGIQIRDAENVYRSFDDVLDDVGAQWENYTKTEQNAISVAIAGSRQRESFEALMNNWGNALKYSETAADSAGSALERYGVYQDSIEAKTNELTAALESLYTNIVSEELYSGILEATAGIVEFLDKTNLLKGTFAGLMAMGVSKVFISMATGIVAAAKSTAQMAAAMALFDKGRSIDNLNDIGAVCKGLNSNLLKLILSMRGLNSEQRLAILKGMGVAESEREQMLAALGFAAAEDKAAASTSGLGITFKDLGRAIKNTVTMNPVGWFSAVIAVIGAAALGIYKLHDALTVTLEEQKEKLKEVKDAYEEVKGEFQEIETEIQNTQNAIKELEGLSSLTWAEQEELERLREVTKELELQKQLKKDNMLQAAEDLYQENRKTIDKEFTSSYGSTSVEDLKRELSSGRIGVGQLDSDNTTDMLTAVQYLNEEKMKLTDSSEIEKYDLFIDSITDTLKEDLSSIFEYKQNILEISGVRELAEDEQATYDYLTSIQKMIYEFYSPATWNSLEFDSIFDTEGLEKTREELIAMTKAGELSPETLQGFPKLSAAIKESELIVGEGSDAFEEFYNELAALADKQQAIVRDSTNTSFADTVSQVQSLSAGLEKLGKIYADVKNKENFDWSSILNNEEFAQTFGNMGAFYDNFIKTVSNAPDDIDACQKAFDKLATSYIYNMKDVNGNNIMDNLTSSTKDATVAILKQAGVVNALEIVEAELAKREEALEVQRIYASEHAAELTDATYKQANAYITEADCSEIAKKHLAQLYLQENLFSGTEISTENDCQNLIELAKTAGYSASVISRLEKLKQMYADNPIMSNVVKEDINRAIKNIFSEAEADIGGIDFDALFDGGASSESAVSAARSITDILDKELTVLDKRMEAGYIDFNNYIKDRLELIEDYYRQGKLSADEYYSYLEKHYKQELSYMDQAVNAVTKRIDKEIGSLEKQKDKIKENYQIQIDAYEKQKTLLEDANRERQRQIDLQKALYELERAKNQRTKLVYSEDRGLHYVADDISIRDAQQEAENAEFEIKIAEIETAILKLEQARDEETEAIDVMIDKLQEYKSQWNDITSAYEESQEDLIAAQMFGREWEEDIVNTRLDILNKFKDDYIAIQQAMVDASYQAAKAMANSENVTIDDSSKDKLGDKDDDTTHGYEVIDEKTATRVGNPFPTEQKAKQYAKKLNEQKAKYNGMTLAQFNISDIPGYYVKKYHTGLRQGLINRHSFDDDFKLVREVGLGDKEVPAILKVGEAVATPEQISNLADGIRNASGADEFILLPADNPALEFSRRFEAYMANHPDNEWGYMNAGFVEHQLELNKLTGQSSAAAVITKNVQPSINVGDINITCPGITSQEVARQIGVEVNHLFNGLHLDAYQQSMIR